MKCQFLGCDEEATHTPRISIPAKRVPLDQHDPMKMYCGVQLCDAHCALVQVRDYFPPEYQKAMRQRHRNIGLRAPDFKRAWVTSVALTDPEYLTAEKFVSEQNGQREQ